MSFSFESFLINSFIFSLRQGSLFRPFVLFANNVINDAFEAFHKMNIDRSFLGSEKHYQKIYASLVFYSMSILKDEEEAEDIASKSIEKYITNTDKEQINNLKSWLFTVTRNESINRFNQIKNRKALIMKNQNLIAFEQSIDNSATIEIEKDAIQQFIKENMDTISQQIWQMHCEGFNNEEISEATQLEVKTVANRKSRIRHILKTYLKKHA